MKKNLGEQRRQREIAERAQSWMKEIEGRLSAEELRQIHGGMSQPAAGDGA